MIGNGHTAPATGKEDSDAQTLLANVEEFIYDESVQQELLAKIGENDPATAIGAITGQLIHLQVVIADGTGAEISRDILMSIAGEIINMLIELAMEAGMLQIQDEQQLEQIQGDSLIAAVDAYMSLGDEKVDGEAASRLTEEVMGGQVDSAEAQQGLLGDMSGQGMPPEGMPPQGGPPPEALSEGGPPPEAMSDEGAPPMGQQGMIGGMV